jgi:hypothetical protein
MTQEVWLFGRMAAFGLLVGGGYWLLTDETAGTIMLVAFGFASLVAAVAVFAGSRAGRRRSAEGNARESAAIAAPGPRPGWAPLGLAIGLGAVALGAAFGPWLAIAGGLVALRSSKAWLDATIDEADVDGRTRPHTDQ